MYWYLSYRNDCSLLLYALTYAMKFYGPTVDPATTKCDYVFNETVLAYSHDDINNLGHSMSDIMVTHTYIHSYQQMCTLVPFMTVDNLFPRMFGQCCGCQGWVHIHKT